MGTRAGRRPWDRGEGTETRVCRSPPRREEPDGRYPPYRWRMGAESPESSGGSKAVGLTGEEAGAADGFEEKKDDVSSSFDSSAASLGE